MAEPKAPSAGDKRYRLSVDTEIIETERYSGLVHCHKRSLDVFDYETLEDAKTAHAKLVSSAIEILR